MTIMNHLILIFITVLLVVKVQSVRFFIVPSADSPCPGEFTGETCLTLMQYNRLTNPFVSNAVILELQPGVHRIDRRFSVSEINSFAMTGTNASIICTFNGRQPFTFTSIANVQISGINFIDCLDSQILSVVSLAMQDCSFQTSSLILQDANATIMQTSFERASRSRVITLVRTSIKFKKCNFTNNNQVVVYAGTRAQSHLTVDGCNFTNNRVQGDNGGAIHFEGGTVTIRSSNFIQNSVNRRFSYWVGRYDGGVVYVNTVDSLIVSDTAFANNRAETTGGAVSITNKRGSVNFTRCNFTNNFVTESISATGGAIGIRGSRDSIKISFTECNFTRNCAPTSGGALHIDAATNVPVLFNKCNFNENGRRPFENTRTGAAVYVRFTSRTTTALPMVSLSECNFTNNGAANRGGAVYLQVTQSHILITESYFTNNTLEFEDTRSNIEYGGALYVAGDENLISVNGGAFVNNSVIQGGGGAVYSTGQRTNFSFVDVLFHNNSASFCGVLEVEEFFHDSVNFTSSSFTSNRATGEVAVSIYRGSSVICIRNASISVVNSAFSNNSAVGNAGVMHIEGSSVAITDSKFEHNSATLDGGVTYTKLSPNNFTIQGSTFSDNWAGDDGGVMYMGRADSLVNVNESSFSFNSATDRGGVFVILGSTLDIVESNFNNNTASQGDVINACISEIKVDGLFEITNSSGRAGCTSYDNRPIIQTEASTMATQTVETTTSRPLVRRTASTIAPPQTITPQITPVTQIEKTMMAIVGSTTVTVAPQTDSVTSTTTTTVVQTDSASTSGTVSTQTGQESTTNVPMELSTTTTLQIEESTTTIAAETSTTPEGRIGTASPPSETVSQSSTMATESSGTTVIQPDASTTIPEPEVTTTAQTGSTRITTAEPKTEGSTTSTVAQTDTTSFIETNTEGTTIPQTESTTTTDIPQPSTKNDITDKSPSTTSNTLSTTDSLNRNNNAARAILGSVGLLMISCVFALVSTYSH